MAGSPKPMGSLSSGLLARKGQARPAMRSQGFGGVGSISQVGDDLGWNDLGQAETAAAPEPAPAAPASGGAIPPVLVQRDRLAATIQSPEAVKSVSVPTAARLRRETQRSGKAAFTLRVDPDRHLRLRLAAAITNRSSQDLVIEALDALLGAVPEVEALIAQLPPAKRIR